MQRLHTGDFLRISDIVLADLIRDIVIPRPDLHGIYHLATRPISKFDLLRLVAERYGKKIELVPDDRASPDRSLVADRFERATGYVAPDWPTLIDCDVLRQIWFGEDMMFTDKVVAITGGTGSFGQHILKGFLATDVAEIRIFSRDEKKQEEMRSAFNNTKLEFYLGDVRAYDSIHQALKGAHYVFHAAALKQVPSCEFYPLEAVRTNILGTENVMSAAVANGVEKVVVLSTDKAVYPINAMGQTKALMEKVMVARSRSLSSTETLLCATRYGNVMVSRGSVIPLFVSQIKAGKPLTITDPNMTRFLTSLDDSSTWCCMPTGMASRATSPCRRPPRRPSATWCRR